MSSGYDILSIDELEQYPSETHDGSILMPLRRRLGLRAFGANCWTAAVGDRVVPRHSELSGNEELYTVVRGRARFEVGDEDAFDAPAGTLVHVPAGTVRQAFAQEPGTVVLAVGGTPGDPFVARGWDEVVVAFGLARAGRAGEGRAVMDALVAGAPDEWEGAYNQACFEARFGDADTAFDRLRRALSMAPDEVRRHAAEDDDLATLRDDPRWGEVTG